MRIFLLQFFTQKIVHLQPFYLLLKKMPGTIILSSLASSYFVISVIFNVTAASSSPSALTFSVQLPAA